MEEIGVSSKSENTVEMFCEHCNEKGQQNITAEGFCVNCVKYFCATCLSFHNEFLPDHVQQDKSSMPIAFYMEKCKNHPQQLLKFYCVSCKAIACLTCKTMLHTQCKEVHHLPKLIEEFDKDKECRDLENILDHLEKEAEEIKGSIDDYRQNIEQHNAKESGEIKDQRDEVDNIFNDFEEEIDKLHNANKNTLDLAEKANDQLKADIQGLKSEVEELKSSPQKCDIYLKTKKLSDQKLQVWKKLSSQKNLLKQELLGYSYNKAPEKMKPEIFGKVTLNPKGVVKGSKILCFIVILILACAIAFASPNVAKNMLTKTLNIMENTFITQHEHIELQISSDIDLRSNSSVLYQENMCYFSKHILFVLDDETVYVYNLTDTEFIQDFHQPGIKEITKVNDRMVAAIFKNRVELWNISSHQSNFDRTVFITLYTGSTCYDIHYCAGNLFLMCPDIESKQTTINKYDTNGKIIDCFTVSRTSTSNMTVSPDCKTIYISFVWNSVQSYTTEGKMIAEYENCSLSYPTQMTVDSKGNLFVLGYYPDNIFYISPDLKYGNELFHTRISHKDSISYSETDDTLCIISSTLKTIKLFKIKRYMKILLFFYIEI